MTLLMMLACKGPAKTLDSSDTAQAQHSDSSPDSEGPVEEVCNGVDDDGDGQVDEGLTFAAWTDADGDGYGDNATESSVCELSSSQVTEGCDCDDTDADANVDPLTCPPVTCPEAGGVWTWGACAQATEIVHDGDLTLTEDAHLTLCSGDQALQLTFEGDRLRVTGEDRDGTNWIGLPPLLVTSQAAEVEVGNLSIGNTHYNNSANITEEGLVILAEPAGVNLTLREVNLDDVDAWIHHSSGVKVGGDLHVEDSSVDHWSMGVGSTYSNVCSSMVLDVGGDLYLTRTNFSEIEQYCRSWSHSSAGEATAYTARVGGDAILEDVVFEGVRLESESSGVYSALLGALLQADGDMTIQGLDIQDSAVVTTMTCQASSCTRVLTGALLQSGGDLSWSAGSIDASPVHLDGTMSGDGSWSDTLWAASIRWSGQTLVLDEVDLGEQPQLDIRGTAEHDGAGKTSLTCTAAGCVEG